MQCSLDEQAPNKEIDTLLSELMNEISQVEDDREDSILREGKPLLKIEEYPQENPPWSKLELANLIRGVFKYGENEWSEQLEDLEVDHSRTPNQLALKWRQVKQLMRTDITRIKGITDGEKIITKHEWMVAAISALEKQSKVEKEESASSLYEALFIDPSKLTPYQ